MQPQGQSKQQAKGATGAELSVRNPWAYRPIRILFVLVLFTLPWDTSASLHYTLNNSFLSLSQLIFIVRCVTCFCAGIHCVNVWILLHLWGAAAAVAVGGVRMSRSIKGGTGVPPHLSPPGTSSRSSLRPSSPPGGPFLLIPSGTALVP